MLQAQEVWSAHRVGVNVETSGRLRLTPHAPPPRLQSPLDLSYRAAGLPAARVPIGGDALAIIRLEGLSLFGHHGARPFEKEAGQRIDVDLELVSLDDRAERSDRLADAVDYDALNRTVRDVVEQRSFHLLEALGAAVAETVLARFPVRSVRLRLVKQNLGWTTGGRAVIEIVRERPPADLERMRERRAAGRAAGGTAKQRKPRRAARKAAR